MILIYHQENAWAIQVKNRNTVVSDLLDPQNFLLSCNQWFPIGWWYMLHDVGYAVKKAHLWMLPWRASETADLTQYEKINPELTTIVILQL